MGIFSGKCTSKSSLEGKVAIITGCNTGIGKCTAADFYKRGCKIIMACRDTAKAEEARKDIIESCKGIANLGNLIVMKLDLGSIESIRKFVEEVLIQERVIHLLVNNAGVFAINPRKFTEDGFEMHLGINHLGHFLLTVLLLPKLIESGTSRIVNVSSVVHHVGNINFEDMNMDTSYKWIVAYGRSKLANILFTKELARRLEGKNVSVYSLHPGAVRTEIDRHMDSGVFFGFRFFWHTVLGLLFFKTPNQGAQTTIYCSVDESLDKESGFYYADCKRASPATKAEDLEVAKKLWEVSWEMLKLGDYNPFN